MIKKRQLAINSLSILVNRLTQSLTSFIIVAFIARILGSYELGQYTLAFSYYVIFVTIASEGFKTLFTRELSRNPLETPIYLVSGTLLQLLFSFIGYALLVIFVLALPYSYDTSIVCCVMGITVIPFALSNITEAIFQAQEKMYLIAISTVPIYILRLLIMLWAMNQSYNVGFLSWIMVISEVLILLIQWGLLLRIVKPQWQINKDFMWRTVKSARTFLGIEGVAVINIRMQWVVLSLLGGEVVVGLYSGVAQLLQPFQIVAQSLVFAVFPGLSKSVTLGREKQRQLTESIIEMLLSVALPLVVGLLFIGRDLLVFLYRDPSFADAAVALYIVAFSLISSSFIRPLALVLVANGFERINLIEVITTTILGGIISVILVSKYQLIGAAIAVLLMNIIGLSQYMYGVYNHIFSLRLWQISRRPLLISILMTAVFLILKEVSQNLLLNMITASLIYVLLISVVSVHALGGPNVVWAKLLRNKQEL